LNHPLPETLLAYDRWATRVIIEACLNLSQADFERPLGLGPGSVERTVNHGIQHRTQVADMLELLGQGLPAALSPFAWDEARRK
jgi:uncharacterized damage-inducible protein DinB